MSDRYDLYHGLPGLLPPGEKLLWQGKPDWVPLARRAFLGGPVAIYFAALAAVRVAAGISDGAPASEVAIGVIWILLVGAAGLAVLGALAWATARATIYSVTTRRVVMRIGAALSLSVNVPFKKVAAATFKPLPGGRGEIALEIGGDERFGYWMLWPHARPWRLARPQPMLRCLPDAEHVAKLIADALAEHQAERGVDLAETAAPAGAPRPAPRPSGGVVPAE